MRKSILILSSLLLLSSVCFGQGKSHVKWEKLEPDIEEYVRVNFKYNKERYVGHKLSKLIDEIEVPFRWGASQIAYFGEVGEDNGKVSMIWIWVDNPYLEEHRAQYERGERGARPPTSYMMHVYVKPVFIYEIEPYSGTDTIYDKDNFPRGLRDLVITKMLVAVPDKE